MERYYKLLKRDKTHSRDLERRALFYILASNDDLYSKVESIYDFSEKSIKSNCLGYSDEKIAENLSLGEEWMDRCSICESVLTEYEHGTCDVCSNIPDFCSSSRKLIKLGFNLFNGYSKEKCDVLSILSGLDFDNFEIALKAIFIRFNT